MTDPFFFVFAVAGGVGACCAFRERAAIAEWLAVRLLAYRDAVTHRANSRAMWCTGLKSEQARLIEIPGDRERRRGGE